MTSIDLCATCAHWPYGQCNGPCRHRSSTKRWKDQSWRNFLCLQTMLDSQKLHAFSSCQNRRILKAYSSFFLIALAGGCGCDIVLNKLVEVFLSISDLFLFLLGDTIVLVGKYSCVCWRRRLIWKIVEVFFSSCFENLLGSNYPNLLSILGCIFLHCKFNFARFYRVPSAISEKTKYN